MPQATFRVGDCVQLKKDGPWAQLGKLSGVGTVVETNVGTDNFNWVRFFFLRQCLFYDSELELSPSGRLAETVKARE